MNNRLSLSPASCLIRILLCVLALHFVAGIGFSAIARKTIKHRRTVAAKPTFQKAIVQTAVMMRPAALMRTPVRRIGVAQEPRPVVATAPIIAGGPWTSPTYADSTVGDDVDGEDLDVRRAARYGP